MSYNEHGELEGESKRRGTGSSEVYNIGEVHVQKNQPILYNLLDGPSRRFVREELMVVKEVQLPPKSVLHQ